MKQTQLTLLQVAHVVSEPGDCTRYEYYVHRVNDEFFFMAHSKNNQINYPTYLNWWDSKNLFAGEDTQLAFAKEKGCNPHTLAECIRTMCELKEADKEQK